MKKFTIPQLRRAVERNQREGTGTSPASLSLVHQIAWRSKSLIANPQWQFMVPEIAEGLMGYPPNWTALKDSATPSSRKSPTKSLKKSGG